MKEGSRWGGLEVLRVLKVLSMLEGQPGRESEGIKWLHSSKGMCP